MGVRKDTGSGMPSKDGKMTISSVCAFLQDEWRSHEAAKNQWSKERKTLLGRVSELERKCSTQAGLLVMAERRMLMLENAIRKDRGYPLLEQPRDPVRDGGAAAPILPGGSPPAEPALLAAGAASASGGGGGDGGLHSRERQSAQYSPAVFPDSLEPMPEAEEAEADLAGPQAAAAAAEEEADERPGGSERGRSRTHAAPTRTSAALARPPSPPPNFLREAGVLGPAQDPEAIYQKQRARQAQRAHRIGGAPADPQAEAVPEDHNATPSSGGADAGNCDTPVEFPLASSPPSRSPTRCKDAPATAPDVPRAGDEGEAAAEEAGGRSPLWPPVTGQSGHTRAHEPQSPLSRRGSAAEEEAEPDPPLPTDLLLDELEGLDPAASSARLENFGRRSVHWCPSSDGDGDSAATQGQGERPLEGQPGREASQASQEDDASSDKASGRRAPVSRSLPIASTRFATSVRAAFASNVGAGFSSGCGSPQGKAPAAGASLSGRGFAAGAKGPQKAPTGQQKAASYAAAAHGAKPKRPAPLRKPGRGEDVIAMAANLGIHTDGEAAAQSGDAPGEGGLQDSPTLRAASGADGSPTRRKSREHVAAYYRVTGEHELSPRHPTCSGGSSGSSSGGVLSPTYSGGSRFWHKRQPLRSHLAPVWGISMEWDDSRGGGGISVLSASEDKTLKLWSIPPSFAGERPSEEEELHGPAGTEVLKDVEPRATLRGHADMATCAELSVAAGVAYSGGLDGAILVWDLPPAAMSLYSEYESSTQHLSRSLECHTDAVWDLALQPGNPRRFVSASADGTLRLWDMSLSRPNLRSYTLSRGGSEQGSLPVTVSFPNAVDASFHTFFLAGFSGGEVCRFDVATGDATVYTAHGGGSGGGVTGMCAVPLGGTCVFASHADGSLSLFDVGRTPPAAAATVLAHGEGCSSAAVAPNGLQVATGSPSGWVRLWDARQLGAHLSEAPMHDPRAGEGVLQLAFAPPLGPTGKPGAAAAPGSQSLPILASAGADGVVQLLALPG